MAVAFPAYGVSINVYFDETTTQVIKLDTTGDDTFIEWALLGEYDREMILFARDFLGEDLPSTGGLADLDTVILPNGQSFTSVYKGLYRQEIVKPAPHKGINTSTDVYYNGSVWKRVVDDVTLV